MGSAGKSEKSFVCNPFTFICELYRERERKRREREKVYMQSNICIKCMHNT